MVEGFKSSSTNALQTSKLNFHSLIYQIPFSSFPHLKINCFQLGHYNGLSQGQPQMNVHIRKFSLIKCHLSSLRDNVLIN